MPQTIVGLNDPKAVRIYSALLAKAVSKNSFFTSKMMDTMDPPRLPFALLVELESARGASISYDIYMQLKAPLTVGDNVIEGQAESMNFGTDTIWIDQGRHAVGRGSTMTQKRTVHDLRMIARNLLAEYWTRWMDEETFIYGAGELGSGWLQSGDWIERAGGSSYPGFANNPIQPPDAFHKIYPRSGTAAKTGLQADDTMTVDFIRRAELYASMLGGGSRELTRIQPCDVDGKRRYSIVMSKASAYDLKSSTATQSWFEYQKAAAGATGERSKLFTDALGMISNVVLHEHENGIMYSDGGGGNIRWSRAMFYGRHAFTMAFGTEGSGMRFFWNEEPMDHKDKLEIMAGCIFGLKKTRFKGNDYGMLAMDHAISNVLPANIL